MKEVARDELAHSMATQVRRNRRQLKLITVAECDVGFKCDEFGEYPSEETRQTYHQPKRNRRKNNLLMEA